MFLHCVLQPLHNCLFHSHSILILQSDPHSVTFSPAFWPHHIFQLPRVLLPNPPPPAPPSDSSWWTFTLTWLGRAHLAVVCVFVCVGLTERCTESMRTHPQHLCVDVGVFVFLCVWSLSAAFLEINTLKGIICFLLWGSSFPPHFKTLLQDNLFIFNDTFILCWYNRIKKGKKARIHKRNALIKLRQYWWLLQAAEL